MLCIPCPHYGSLCFWLLWGLVTSKFSVSRHCKAYILYRARKGWEDSVLCCLLQEPQIYMQGNLILRASLLTSVRLHIGSWALKAPLF